MAPTGRGAVFLLTDYGDVDEFAGVMRAVLLREAPEAQVVDLTHAISPFDVRAGAFALSRSVRYLGPGVVVGVVDPGVGSGRRAVAVAVRGASGGPSRLVGPDNGLLGWALDALGGADAAVALTPAPAGGPTGATFDGRDLFAPVAARLWSGADLHDVGVPIDPGTLVRLDPPRLEVSPGSVEAEVQWVDRFGNAQLAARPADGLRAGLAGVVEVDVGGARSRARSVTSFGALADGEVGLLVDANGHLCLVCPRRPAATVLGVQPGAVVRLNRVP